MAMYYSLANLICGYQLVNIHCVCCWYFIINSCLNSAYVYSLASLFCGYQPVNVQLVYWCYDVCIFVEFYSVYSYWLARCLAISQ